MKKSLIASLAGLLLAASVTTAFAGLKANGGVYVASGYAQGAIGAARNSLDGNQYIGCYATVSSSGTSGYCIASDSTPHYASCTVPSASVATMLPLIYSIGSQSEISFQADSLGYCSSLTVMNLSYYQPAVP